MFDPKRRSLWADDDQNSAVHQYDFDGSVDIPEPSPRNMNLVGMYSNQMSSPNPNFSDTALLDNLERGNHPAFSSNSLKRNRVSSFIPINLFNPMRYFPQLETVYETGRESERFESRRISWMWSGKWSKLTSPKNRPPNVQQNQNSPSPFSSIPSKDENVNLPSINENENIPSIKENERIASIQLRIQSIKGSSTRPFSDTSGDTESSPGGAKPDETLKKNPPSLSGWWKRLSSNLPVALLPSLLHSHHGMEHPTQSFAESGQKSQQGPNANNRIIIEEHYSKRRPSSCNRRYLIAILICFSVMGGVATGIAAVFTSFASANNEIVQDEVTFSPTIEFEEDLTKAPTTLTPTTLTPTASPTIFTTPFPTNTPFPTRSPTINDEDDDD